MIVCRRWISLSLLAAIAAWCLVAAPGRFARAADEKNSAATAESEGGTAHGEGAHAESEPSPLSIDADLAFWTLVVFVVLFVVLSKFAWGPISEALERREHHIAENIAAAQRAQDEAKEMLAEYERKLAGAADQVRDMLEEARKDAEVTKQQIVAEAKAAAQAEHARGMHDVRVATDAAVEELSQRSADLAIAMAGKIISAKLTAEERAKLVQESLTKFVAAAPSKN